jgi:hypothetical protein
MRIQYEREMTLAINQARGEMVKKLELRGRRQDRREDECLPCQGRRDEMQKKLYLEL